MKHKTVTQLFNEAKGHARSRGIPFEFTQDDWIYWWEEQLGFDWILKRGRHHDQYVMARKNDIGPYAAWNIDCVLSGVNSARISLAGKTISGKSKKPGKLTEAQVLEIYRSKESKWVLAEKYNVRSSVIYRIRTRRAWAWLTES